MAVYSLSEEKRRAIARTWPDILLRLAAGELIKDVRGTFTDYDLRAYRALEDGAQAQWDAARESSADAYMEEAMDCARSEISKELAQHARTRIDTLKWAARIRNPRLYGDRATVDLNVRTVDLTKIIGDANARLSAARVIEGSVVRQVLPAPGELDALL